MVATIERVSQFVSNVTPEQIGKCHEVWDAKGRFWMVENEAGAFNVDNELIEYEVRYSREFGFTCTCASGQVGFSNVFNPSGVCKHCLWSVAASIEMDMAMAEIAVRQTEEHRPSIESQVPAWILNPRLLTSHRVSTAKSDPWID